VLSGLKSMCVLAYWLIVLLWGPGQVLAKLWFTFTRVVEIC